MPRIREYNPEFRSTTAIPSPAVDADTFMAPGRALAGLGRSLVDAGEAFKPKEHTDRKDAIEAEVQSAKLRGVVAQKYIERQNTAAEGAPGFRQSTYEDFDKTAEEAMKDLPSGVREKMRSRVAHMREDFGVRAGVYEAESTAKATRNKAGDALATSQNTIALDPSQYDAAARDARSLIDGLGLDGDMKAQTWRQWEAGASKTRFEALIYKTETPDQLTGIEKQLGEDVWKQRLNPADLDGLQRAVRSQRASLQAGLDARGRSAVQVVEDRLKAGEQVPPDELALAESAVRATKDPALAHRWGSLRVTNDAKRHARRQTPGALAAEVKAYSPGGRYRGVTGSLSAAIETASAASGGDISVAYLSRNALRESSGGRNKGNPSGSSAAGSFQFVDSTWLSTIRAHAGKYGIDIAGKSEAELLALRDDDQISAYMAVAYSQQNKKLLKDEIGRDPSDAELYMAHFLGPGGAARFLKGLAADPNQPATNLVAERSAGANKRVFYKSEGRGAAKSAAEVMAAVESGFSDGTSAYDYARVTAIREEQQRQEIARGKSGDIMTYASQELIALGDLDSAEALAVRGRQALEVQRFYDLPDARPLTATETDELAARAKNGNVDDVMSMIRDLTAMGPKAADAAFRQIGDKDGIFGVAAGLAQASPTGMSTARDIIAGQRRIQENPDVTKSLREFQRSEGAFNAALGTTMSYLAPRSRQALREATDALYVERYGASEEFNEDRYHAVLREALGGKPGADGHGFGNVNGEPVALPPGVSETRFEKVIQSFKPADLIALSVNGRPPMFDDGSLASPEDIADEGKFRAVMLGIYAVSMGDGNDLISGFEVAAPSGSPRRPNDPLPPPGEKRRVRYLIRIDNETIQQLERRREMEAPE